MFLFKNFQDRAIDPANRFSATTTLTVNILDSDDQPPKFVHDSYSTKVVSGIGKGNIFYVFETTDGAYH